MPSCFERILNSGIKANEESFGFLILCMMVSLSGGLIFGYNTGVIAPALSQMSLYFAPMQGEYHLSSFIEGVITCAALLGAMIGSVSGATIVALMGYKLSFLLTGMLTVVGALVSAALSNLGGVIAVRVVLGLGIGLSSSVCPGYVSEMSPARHKGKVGALFQLSLTLGILIAYALGLGLFISYRQQAELQWRTEFAVGAAPGSFAMIIAVLMPESHQWLEQHRPDHRHQHHHHHRSETDPLHNRGFRGADEAAAGDDDDASQRSNLRAWGDLFCRAANRKSLGLGLMMAIALQLTGINAFIYFSPTIFAQAGFPPGAEGQGPLITTTVVGLWNFLSTIVCAALVDRVGRKPLLISGIFFMSWATLTMGFIWLFVDGVAKGGFAIGLTFVYILAFEASIGSLFWVILTEVYPAEVKDVGFSFANLVQWTFNLLLSAFFLPLTNAIGIPVVFFAFGIIGVVSCLVFAFYLPETKENTHYYIDDHALVLQ